MSIVSRLDRGSNGVRRCNVVGTPDDFSVDKRLQRPVEDLTLASQIILGLLLELGPSE